VRGGGGGLGDTTWKMDKIPLTYLAIEKGNQTILDILTRHGAEWSKEWKIDQMAFLHKAVIDRNHEVVKMILSKNYYVDGDSDWIYVRELARNKAKSGYGDNWIYINNMLKETEDKNKKMHTKSSIEPKQSVNT